MYNNNIIKQTTTQEVSFRNVTEVVESSYTPYVVRASLQNNFIEVTSVRNTPKQTIKKLNKQEYLDLQTGEIKEFNLDNTGKEQANLKRTFNNLRGLIRTNFSENATNQLFITLTYRKNMKDSKQLYEDFKLFYKNLQYRYKDKFKFEYIAIAEPQERGAWHMHVLLKTQNDADILFIDNKALQLIWGHGYTDTQKLKSDDVGTYFVAYFTDLIDESKKPLEEMSSEEKSKARVKGGRLHFYPKGFKFYRTSRGIVKPTILDNVVLDDLLETHSVRNAYSYDIVNSVTGATVNSGYKATLKAKDKPKPTTKKKYTKAKLDEYNKP